MPEDALSRIGDLTDEQWDALVEIADARVEGRLTRRDALKAGGVLAALGLGGGAAAGTAAADASTTDGDGNVGRPTNRVDVFSDGVDALSVSTGALRNINGEKYQAIMDGLLVPCAPGFGVEDAIDPSTTDTPFQDLTNDIEAAGTPGTIRWSGVVDELATYTPKEAVSLVGVGRGDITSASGLSAMRFPNDVGEAIKFGTDSGGSVTFDQMMIRGPGYGTTTQTHAVTFADKDFADIHFGTVAIQAFYGSVFRRGGSGETLFQSTIGEDAYFEADAGDSAQSMIDLPSGPQVSGGNWAVYPRDDVSGSTTEVIKTGGGLEVDAINAGGTGLGPLTNTTSDGACRVGTWNWEPTHSNSVATMHRVGDNTEIGPGRASAPISSPSVDSVFEIRGGQAIEVHNPTVNVPVSTARVKVNTETTREDVVYHGPSADLLNNTATSPLPYGISCLGDMVNATL